MSILDGIVGLGAFCLAEACFIVIVVIDVTCLCAPILKFISIIHNCFHLYIAN